MELALKETITEILAQMGVATNNVIIKIEEDGMVCAEISSPDSSLLIGYHGEAINALQQITKNVLWTKYPERLKEKSHFMIDVDGYRRRQQESIINLAERKAEMARNTKEPQVLPPMSSFFRRIVHMHLSKESFADLRTESVGSGDRRAVRIIWEEQPEGQEAE